MGRHGDEVGNEDRVGKVGEPSGGCAVHGAALLIASAAAITLMAVVTFGCWLLYRLVA